MSRLATILLISIFLVSVTSCQDELVDRYQNPNRDATPTIGEFFTSMLNNDRVRPSYWNISTFVNWHVGVYSQSVGYLNAQSMYQQNEAYIQDRWDDYYRPGPNGSGVVAVFREIEKAYNKLSPTEKSQAGILFHAAQIVLYDQTSQMVDLWGDIPFSQAGALNATGQIVYPGFDSAEDIYQTMTDDLKLISEYFSAAEWSTSALREFSRQDILLQGDTDRWHRYCNSLRLRLLMRLSFVSEESSKEQVLEMLNNPAQFPLLNAVDYVPANDDVLLHPLTTYNYDLHSAFEDWTNYPAPYYSLEQVLKPVNDLRIPVLFDKYGNTENENFIPNESYNALPLTFSLNDQKENLEQYAILDSVTFLFNTKLPGVVFTSSEVNFLKAEAFERWGGGDAAAEYFTGIRNSIRFYYYINELNTSAPGHSSKPIAPTEEQIDEFLSSAPALQYDGTSEERLVKTWTQKWIHFGFLQSTESWSELRRTGYPQLQFHPASLSGYELPPNRLTYPANEKIYNENYAKVSSSDSRETKLFWQR
jgi:hypothetical protein